MKLAKPIQEPKLVLFDMDGVLFDTMPYHVRSWKQSMDEYDIEAEQDEFYLYEGMKGIDTIAQLYERTFGFVPEDDLIMEIYRRKTELFNSDDFALKTIPYTRQVMELLKARGIEIAVVTGSTELNAFPRIKECYADLIDKQHVITAESVERGKPHPEPYIRGMQLFDCTPEQTIVIENAPLGVRSGADSGAFVIAVNTGPISIEQLRNEGANLVMNDMKALLIWFEHIGLQP